ncbi:hypothetical protein [Streptacidiphilus fuscans]|uniref:Secreted protein n=1 Tax=Streptacidiphilus fuscans TaxID=2789292 RepID=A0A931AVZ9_9ACTN|nr:hypothetical protein [Streptacidiphilus fuscans]MBF9066490.1 hypothetical protein [Streptacidiphilus fuscans]
MQRWTGRITKAVVAGAVAVAGLAAGAGSAHAAGASAYRSDNTGGNYTYAIAASTNTVDETTEVIPAAQQHMNAAGAATADTIIETGD